MADADIDVEITDYRPTASQAKFHASRARIKAFLGGYGSGKTRALGEEALDLAAENPGCDGMIVAPTWGVLHRVTLRSFFDVDSRTGACPPGLIRHHHVGKRFFELVNGARIYYGSADRPSTLEGQNLAWWGLDEPSAVRSEAYRILLGRLREVRAKRLQAFIVGTPIASWLRDEFGQEKPDRFIVHASTRENAVNLAPGFVENLERTYSARQARVLIDGEFGLFAGVVYESFDRKVHVIPWKYNSALRTICSIDFGKRRPAALFLQHVTAGTLLPGGRRAPDHCWVVFDEIVLDDISTEVLALRIKEKGYRLDGIYCDPAGDGAQVATGISDVHVLKSYGLPQPRFVTEPRLRWIPTGVALVEGMLLNTVGETRLYFSEQVAASKASRGVVKDIERYHYAEEKPGQPMKDHPVKDGESDHTMDALRYFSVNESIRGGFLLESIPLM